MQTLGPFAGLVVAIVASAVVGTPFLGTAAGRRALRPFTGDTDERDPYAAAGIYLGLSVAYAGLVVVAGESAADAGVFGLTLTLLLPFAFGVAAATTWLPSAGVEWRPAGEARVDATLTFAGFLATLTAAATGGWLLVG